jgi:hypothetical protein
VQPNALALDNDAGAFGVQRRHVRIGMKMVLRVARLQRRKSGEIVHGLASEIVITFSSNAAHMTRRKEAVLF